jgi:hypothetical protein
MTEAKRDKPEHYEGKDEASSSSPRSVVP